MTPAARNRNAWKGASRGKNKKPLLEKKRAFWEKGVVLEAVIFTVCNVKNGGRKACLPTR